MERKQRIWLIAVAVVIAAAGIFLIQSGGDDEDEPESAGTQTQQTQPEEPTGTVKAPTPKPEPEFQKVAIVNGKVQGGEQEIEVERGETARIEITSDTPDEIHVHGYELTKPVGPSKPARFRFKADAEGIFEIEAHDLGHLVVGTLVVEP